ncbi:MAG: hypothetical protein WBX25_35095 [Rhodomicrobium sp.]
MLAKTEPNPVIRSREITGADFHVMAAFFARGLGYPAWAYLHIFELLRDHPTPEGYPKYGYILEANGSIVGGIILIFSSVGSGDKKSVRCQLTAWYVEPAYRTYSTIFTSKALRFKDVTYVNLTARPAARPIVEAQGFIKFSKGQFVAIPSLNFFLSRGDNAKAVKADAEPEGVYDLYERKLLLDHQKYGNICFWCVTASDAFPFVFKPRIVKHVIPAVQLLYCRDIQDLARFARPIALHLASYGRFFVFADANERITGLIGHYFDGMYPRWYKGPKPRLGDLSYTLPALFPASG